MGADAAPSNEVDQAITAAVFVQRDLNCLSDPDQNIRRKALEQHLVTESRSPAMRAVTDGDVLAQQLQCIQDDSELHRDAASLIETVAEVTGYESLEQLYA
ncbi:hypothetical protein SELMODRAFT_410758 [Selaginella moellendorffii]|uniref:Uncharacterized protein n=1 Tax=Selaginella moellendorffii TaxID=88036 RepID=D8RFS3_SELML|nr:hypothetical protein SELMODRAFT_410758 [Selaginella moellendorffii]